jgi:rubrerythrin
MNIADSRKEIIELLSKNEELIAELYIAYSEKFPDYRDFWREISEEEIKHSRWMRSLQAYTDDILSFDEDRIKPELMRISLTYLEKKLNQAETEEMAIADALTIALELETNMIERNYFKLFHGDSDELKSIFQNLESDTQKHTNRVRNTLGSLKKHGLSRG